MAARLRFALLLLLIIGLVSSLALLVRQHRQLATDRRQLDRDQQALRALQDALRRRGLPQPAIETEDIAPEDNHHAALAQRDATIVRLTEELHEAQSNLAALQGQLTAATDDRQQAVAAAAERSQKEQTDWLGKLDALQKQLDAAEAEADASRQRLSALEAENDKLRGDRQNDSSRTTQLAGTVSSLQDLDRRRDVYLTSIMRRYRDITSQFRASSGMLDSSHDPNSTALSGPALTRIQNAIAQADDDLRQLNELNAQAHQLEKKLASK